MRFKSLQFICAALAAGVLLASSASAAPSGFRTPFSYFADQQELSVVLSSFARAQGLSAQVDSGLKGKVSGRFQKVPAKDFLAAMQEAYGVGCYVLGRTAHFYSVNDFTKDFLIVPSGSSRELLKSLQNSGFIAPELPVRISEDGSMLSIQGPASYVESIRAAAAAYQTVMTEKVVMRVFPVKYAWADDITLENMDQSVTVPGIASILRGMVLGQSVGGETVSKQKNSSTAANVPSLGGDGLSKQSIYRGRKDDAAGGETPAAGSVSIIADPRMNAVVVSDAAFRMPYYEEVIRELDKPVELVEIHAAIVDIDTNASRELGVNFSGKGGSSWQAGGSLGSSNSGGYDASGNPIVNTVTGSAGAMISTIYTHGSDYFMARINALESENAARMLGRPSVLTVDNVQAVLENTTTYYIPLQGTEAVDLYKVESGTVLRVTPHIIHSGDRTSIKLAVSVQDDQNDGGSGYQSIGGENSTSITVSPIKQTKISTQAMVDVGQSLLIGGYYYEKKSEGTDGVPILKDIPLLGALFRSSSKSGQQMERLILITPRIVTADVDNVPSHIREGGFEAKATQANYERKSLSKPQKAEGAEEAQPSGRKEAR